MYRVKSLLWLLILCFFISFCHKEEHVTDSTNPIISNIAEGDAFEQGSMIRITIDIKDDQASAIKHIKGTIDSTEVFTSQEFPFDYNWNTENEDVGTHLLQFISTDIHEGQFITNIPVRLFQINNKYCQDTPVVTDIDGNQYRTIQIGDQCWMKENLKVTHYADGTPLVDGSGVGNTQYDTITKYYFNYKDDEHYAATYGRLYIWMAAVNGHASEED